MTLIDDNFTEIGFKSYPHKILPSSLRYDLGRGRGFAIQNLGTPNEFLWIIDTNPEDPFEITDLICLHNYDYDGYLTLDKVKMLITGITGRVF